MEDVDGKVAFITGGASGLGLAMARSFSAAGMRVAIADIEDDALVAAQAEFSESNANVITMKVDVTDRAALEKAAKKTESIFEKVHVVCNNAGVAMSGNIKNHTYKDWDWVMGVNLDGVINGVQVFANRILSHGEGGHIVNTASMAGLTGIQGLSVYNTSKFAVVGMSEAIAADLKHYGVGVSVLCPGFVATGIYTSERNRPQHLGGIVASAFALSKDEFRTKGELASMQESLDGMLHPDLIGDMVLHAIHENEFWIFSHPEYKEGSWERSREISDAFDRWESFISDYER